MHRNININRTKISVLAVGIPSVGPRGRISYREISWQEFPPEGFPAVRSRSRISFREISQALAAGCPAARSRRNHMWAPAARQTNQICAADLSSTRTFFVSQPLEGDSSKPQQGTTPHLRGEPNCGRAQPRKREKNTAGTAYSAVDLPWRAQNRTLSGEMVSKWCRNGAKWSQKVLQGTPSGINWSQRCPNSSRQRLS